MPYFMHSEPQFNKKEAPQYFDRFFTKIGFPLGTFPQKGSELIKNRGNLVDLSIKYTLNLLPCRLGNLTGISNCVRLQSIKNQLIIKTDPLSILLIFYLKIPFNTSIFNAHNV